MGFDYIDEKKFKALVKQISGTITEKDGELVPYHRIKGKGDIWCFHMTTRAFIRLIRGNSIYVINWGTEADDKCLVYCADGSLVLISKEEIEEIGFD
jgi:hypothetical protein|tara:strand:+ start:467 stop:757 length:291 start_codon:yes stop_codon:yes gene_type:complete